MISTRGNICELIQRALNGGFASDDTEITIPLINLYLNSAIGFAVKSNYKETIQLEGTEGVSDGFYAIYTGISITKDALTGLYSATLPQQPAGVGAGWDVSYFMIITGSGKKLFAYPISAREIPYLYDNGSDCNEIYYWTNKNIATLHSCNDITKYKAQVRMICTQSDDMSSTITLPDGYLPVVIEYMAKTLGIQIQVPIDVSSDGVPTTQIKG